MAGRWPWLRKSLPQILPAPGWVEHDPEVIWASQLNVARQALERAATDGPRHRGDRGDQSARDDNPVGTLSGRPVANAIVWQSRVSAGICQRLKADGHEPLFRERTGLVLDAYFSGTKIKHLLDTRAGLRERAAKGEILFGTVDTWLMWRLERRQVAPDGLQQCQPHPAVQHPHARVGRRTAPRARRSAGDAARSPPVEPGLRPKPPPSGSASRFHWPAARATNKRPPLARPVSKRQRQEHVRHRLLPAAEHRRPAGGRARTTC